MSQTAEFDLLESISLPSRLGSLVGKEQFGVDWEPYPFILDMEREIVEACLREDTQDWFIVNCPNQVGKALALATKVPTPTGWTTMGEIRVGDQVLGADGKPCNVIGVSQRQTRVAHRVVFDDGQSSIVAGPEHLWTTFDQQAFRSYSGSAKRNDLRTEHDEAWWDWESPTGLKPQTRDTATLLATLKNKHGVSNHCIPNAQPLHLPEADLPIDPWVLGYWVGNGSRGTGTICSGSHGGDQDESHVRSRVEASGMDIRSVTAHPEQGHSIVRITGLLSRLRQLGIDQSKRIPDVYFRASIEQRMELLRGLMDSDGGHEHGGLVSLSSKDEHIVQAVEELVASLGGKTSRSDRQAKLNGVEKGMSYRVTFAPPFNPFSLPRKADLWQPSEVTGRSMLRRTRTITDIQVGEPEEMVCISVDSPGNLYLAGEQMVVTHNTTWVGILLAFWYIGMFPDKQVIFISYSDAYSMDYGRAVRDLFREHGQRLFGLTVDPQTDAAGDWKLKGHPAGGMLSVGVGGQITGKQGHLVIIDDILRNMVDAASVPTKDAHWKDWQGTIYGRRQPGCVYVVTATRLALDDLSGRLKDQQKHSHGRGIQWVELSYPGICEPPDDYEGDPADYRDRLGRKVGEPLHTRFTKPTDTIDDNWWTQARDTLNNIQLFDCMVQQNPGRSSSGMFPDSKWKLVLRADWPELHNKVRAWDMGSTEGGGDYTVGALMGRDHDGEIYVCNRIREQFGLDRGLQEVKVTAATDGQHIPIVIEEERSGAGKNLVEFYRKALPGYQVHAARAEGTKELRAKPYSILQQGGHVTLPADDDDQEWVTAWIKEHSGMMGDSRRGKHDDQIDAGAYAVNFLLEHGIVDIIDPNELSDNDYEMFKWMEEMGLDGLY